MARNVLRLIQSTCAFLIVGTVGLTITAQIARLNGYENVPALYWWIYAGSWVMVGTPFARVVWRSSE